MNGNNVLFWLYIVLGNLCFILMLQGIRKLSQKSSVREAKGMLCLVSILLLLFLWFDPVRKETQFLGMVVNNELGISSIERWILGNVCAVVLNLPALCYHLFVSRRIIYQKREERYIVYVYHNGLSWGSYVLWVVTACEAMMIVAAVNDKAKVDVTRWLGVLLVAIYMGVVLLSILQGQIFVVTDREYHYYSFKKKISGKPEDIEPIETNKKALLLKINGEEIPIWCGEGTYRNLFYEYYNSRIKVKED